MAAGVFNFIGSNQYAIEQGAQWGAQITIKEGGVAKNLTGYSAAMHIRTAVDSSTTLLELTTENGKITNGGVTGTLDLLVSTADTTEITWVEGVYDLEITLNGETMKILRGIVGVVKEVTRV